MKLRVLGSSGAEVPGYGLSAFLVNDSLLLDAGAATQSLTLEEQKKIKDILITHSHLDHIKDIAFLADNLILDNHVATINVYALRETIDAIRTYILNDIIWPDFTKIPSEDSPVLKFVPITPGQKFKIGDYNITPLPVKHSVPAVGYLVNTASASFVYTGDTGPSDALWEALINIDLQLLIIEVSFPDSMRDMAVMTGHLCPSLLRDQLSRCQISCERVLVTHIKPQYEEIITRELAALEGYSVEVLDSPRTIDLP